MATLAAAGALSHSPLINRTPPAEEAAAIERYRGIAKKLGEHFRKARPDVLVIVGQDHMRTLFYDLMPAFAIGTGRVDGWGDWGTAKGPFPTSPALARHIHRFLLADGFDAACSYDMRIDHGIAQPLQLLDVADTMPIVPILINTGAPPLPTPWRCFEFGESLMQAIASFDQPLRVGIIGSGGISHSPPSGNVESEAPADAAMVEQLIHGRAQVAAREMARQEGLVNGVLAGKFRGSVRPEWDRMILDRLGRGEAATLARNLDEASIDRDGGYGGQEIRTWLAIGGACGGAPMEVLGYEPIDFLITGMGAVKAL